MTPAPTPETKIEEDDEFEEFRTQGNESYGIILGKFLRPSLCCSHFCSVSYCVGIRIYRSQLYFRNLLQSDHFLFCFIDWTKKDEDGKDLNVWKDNWDDDNVEDDFSVQLRLVLFI